MDPQSVQTFVELKNPPVNQASAAIPQATSKVGKNRKFMSATDSEDFIHRIGGSAQEEADARRLQGAWRLATMRE